VTSTKSLKLGKLPARPGAYSFKLGSYLEVAPGYVAADKTSLPVAPAVFGHQDSVSSYGMLANDQYGDCVFAGAAHETMIWTALGGNPRVFNDHSVLSDYSAVTGFSPSDPNSDQGTDMEEAAKYRRKTGVIDALGKRHTIDAYLELPGVSARGDNDYTRLIPAIATSAYVFAALGIGVQFPASAMDQFDAGKPWDVVKNSPIEGGHYVPLVGRRSNGNFVVITWGKLQEVTPAFLGAYVDEAVAYVSLEQFVNGKTPEGFDIAALQADLALLGNKTPVPQPTPAPTPTPTPTPAPTPVSDPNVKILDTWAAAKHVGTNAAAAKAWKAYKAAHNL